MKGRYTVIVRGPHTSNFNFSRFGEKDSRDIHRILLRRDLVWVRVVEVEERLQVYYCNTLIRELDADVQRSTIVERWIRESSAEKV